MIYEQDQRFTGRGGAGFGFRGSATRWPYIGRGRRGLPRCSAPGLNIRSASEFSITPPITNEQEAELLKKEAGSLRRRLDEIEQRIGKLESTGNK